MDGKIVKSAPLGAAFRRGCARNVTIILIVTELRFVRGMT